MRARGLYATAPRAGQHPLDGNAARSERFADASRVRPAGVGEVALRAAVVEPHAGRVARAGRGHGMADEDNLAAAFSSDHSFSSASAGAAASQQERERKQSATTSLDTSYFFASRAISTTARSASV